MSLYTEKDIILLSSNWENIMKEVEEQKYLMIEPSKEEMISVHKIICDFVKEHKRKIYGGFGLNLLVKEKSPKEAIYKEGSIADIDFYSPHPIIDLIKLCNILHNKGFKGVIGREAQHQETYNITVNYLTYCDISYVPKNIYDKMPFKEIENYIVIHPHFMWIDYLRMFTDPLISYWRMNDDLKSFKRFFLLQKYFKFPKNDYPIEIEDSTKELDLILSEIFKFITDNKTTLTVGFYAYNYFLNESGLLNNKQNNRQSNTQSNLKLVNIPYFEIISTRYREDCLQLLYDLSQIPLINQSKLTHQEFYPFFQFTDHSVEIYYDGDIVAKIYNHNRKCIPYIDVPAIDFSQTNLINSTKSTKSTNSVIRLATFPTVLSFSIISIMKARTQSNDDDKNLHYAMTSHLIEMRKYYFLKNKKTMLDNSVFREFTAKCMGDTIPPDRQRKLLIESRKKKNKKWIFSYEPSEGIKDPESTYLFANTSGNKIINTKNLKLSIVKPEDDIEGDFDEEGLDEKIGGSTNQPGSTDQAKFK